MPPSIEQPSAEKVLERLREHVQEDHTKLGPDAYENALSLHPVDAPASSGSQMSFWVEGPKDISFRLTLELTSTGENACDVYAETVEGRSRHFSCDLSLTNEEARSLRGVARSLATFLLSEIEQRRTQGPSQLPDSSDTPPHVPLLILDENGTIQEVTASAQRILCHSPESSLDPNFFTHVHGQNLRRVMQDLAYMVSRQKQRAHWLLRLRTGNRRWRWFRAIAEKHLDHSAGAVRVLLRPL